MKEKQKKKRTFDGFGLLAVQSVSCAVVVLAVLVLRLIGGNIFAGLGTYFEESMRENTLAAAIHALWDDEDIYTVTTTTVITTATATTPPTAATTTAATTKAAAAATATPTAAAAAASTAMPVAGATVSSGYGTREDPLGGGEEFHTGIDFAADEGTVVAAVWGGRVVTADSVGETSLGKYVVIRHDNGLETVYAHCSELKTTEGAQVATGETVALVGSSGAATGPHLHFEVRRDGEACDPALFLPEFGV